MAKERALTLEALRVMDAIDRRGSFAAAADELGRVPSALSYTMQKLEEELDVVLFDRSGHRTKFTNVGRMLLERGRVLLEAADKLTTDAEALSRGWETHLTIVTEALVPTPDLFPLIEKLATKSNTCPGMLLSWWCSLSHFNSRSSTTALTHSTPFLLTSRSLYIKRENTLLPNAVLNSHFFQKGMVVFGKNSLTTLSKIASILKSFL